MEMNGRRIVVFYTEYNPKEKGNCILQNSIVAKARLVNIHNCPFCYVSEAIKIIADTNNLNVHIKSGFSKAKKILINSVINN
jgi:hypothetical protein